MGNYMPADGCRSVWLMVTADEYELPVAVADTAEELARIVGVSVATIYSMISKSKRYGWRCKYIQVRVPIDGREDKK